jgi:hypothetical protein
VSVICPTCGSALKSNLALMSHEGSRPCRLARTERRMAEIGWTPCREVDAEQVLANAEVDYERAPVAYVEGGLASRSVDAQRPRFKKPALADGIWCPRWAQLIVDQPLSNTVKTTRFRLLRWAAALSEDVRENVVRTTLALADDEAISLIANGAWAAHERQLKERWD